MTAIDPSILQRRWVHSHEEDTDTEQVFRPASYSFPPSRGRSAFELEPDGSYSESTPGPTDVPEESGGGRWELDADTLKLRLADGSSRALRIISASPDRLVVSK